MAAILKADLYSKLERLEPTQTRFLDDEIKGKYRIKQIYISSQELFNPRANGAERRSGRYPGRGY
jgi:hypothetical protein